LQTGYSFGFGFVEYHKPEDAAKAILQLNNLPVQHKRIKVSYARPPGEDIKETNLYIQNIPRCVHTTITYRKIISW
jgi:protein sex-lethal